MKPTLNQLRIFQAVAQHGSFTRAAEALHLSQPAVSIQVKQLENTVGLPLYEQLGKTIYFTEAGQIILACARGVAGQLEDAAEAIDNLRGIKRGHLKVSVATTAGSFVTRMLAMFADHYPEVSVSLDVTNREKLLRHLAGNEQDLIIMGEPPNDSNLVATSFMDNPLVLVAAPEHPLAGRTGLPVDVLRDQPFVLREKGSGTRATIQRFFDRARIKVRVTMEMTSNEAIKQAVQAGLGLGIASRHTLELELETERLVELDVEGFPIPRHWYLVRRSGKQLSPVAQLFESFVLEQGQFR